MNTSESRTTAAGGPAARVCRAGVFAALIALCAQLSVPLPSGVPMTLQTFAVALAGIVLGKRDGTLATVFYVVAGLAGAPVFAGFNGGPGALFGRTGGFIVSFPAMAFLSGIGAQKESQTRLIAWLALGAAVNFAGGMIVYSLVTSTGLLSSFVQCVLPYLPAGAVKVFLAASAGRAVKSAVSVSRQRM